MYERHERGFFSCATPLLRFNVIGDFSRGSVEGDRSHIGAIDPSIRLWRLRYATGVYSLAREGVHGNLEVAEGVSNRKNFRLRLYVDADAFGNATPQRIFKRLSVPTLGTRELPKATQESVLGTFGEQNLTVPVRYHTHRHIVVRHRPRRSGNRE